MPTRPTNEEALASHELTLHRVPHPLVLCDPDLIVKTANSAAVLTLAGMANRLSDMFPEVRFESILGQSLASLVGDNDLSSDSSSQTLRNGDFEMCVWVSPLPSGPAADGLAGYLVGFEDRTMMRVIEHFLAGRPCPKRGTRRGHRRRRTICRRPREAPNPEFVSLVGFDKESELLGQHHRVLVDPSYAESRGLSDRRDDWDEPLFRGYGPTDARQEQAWPRVESQSRGHRSSPQVEAEAGTNEETCDEAQD